MPFATPDRVLETSTSTGTGPFTLAGAVAGYQAFAARLSVGDTCYYAIEAVDAQGVPTGQWACGIGTYSAANTLTTTTPIDGSSGLGVAVNFGAGTKRVMIVPLGARYRGVKVEVFEAPGGTFTLDADAVAVQAILIGGGAGGGSGRRNATNAARQGGGGGGGGGVSDAFIALSAISSPVTVTVGFGGTGGPAPTVDNGNGQVGTAGGDTTFGTLLRAGGGAAAAASGANPITGGLGGTGTTPGGQGGTTSSTAACVAPAPGTTGGGGGGGGLSTANAAFAAAAGGNGAAGTAGNLGTTGTGGAGGAGSGPAAGVYVGGSGGGGGGCNTAGGGGAGGAGATPGGGGGGSGATTNGATGGPGGNGGDGRAIIITYY